MEFSARLNDLTELPCLYGERGELPEPMNGVVEADETYIGGLAAAAKVGRRDCVIFLAVTRSRRLSFTSLRLQLREDFLIL